MTCPPVALRNHSLLALIVMSLATPAALEAFFDPLCSGGPGGGLAVTNDNGFRAPFRGCDDQPVSHIYGCGAGPLYLGDLRLGTELCICSTTTGLRFCPVNCGTGAAAINISWCGINSTCGGASGTSAEDGVTITPVADGAIFDICYRAIGAASPTILLRIGQLGQPPVERVLPQPPASTMQSCVSQAVPLADGDWDVQVTLYDCPPRVVPLGSALTATDGAAAAPTGPMSATPGQEIYWGGETENYQVCIGAGCTYTYRRLRSNH